MRVWDVLRRDRGKLVSSLLAVQRWLVQYAGCDGVHLYSDYLPDWDLRYWYLCVRTMLACNGVHCEWAERAAAVLLECDHAGGKLNWRLAGWAADSGEVQ